MSEKRSGLTRIWEKIEAIKTKEIKSRLSATVDVISQGIQSGIDQFDDFIEGNFNNSIVFLGKEYSEQSMIDYVNDLSDVMQKDNRSWLNSMAIEDVFQETLSVCPKVLKEVFEEEKSKGYDGLPISFEKSLKVQNFIPSMKFLKKSEIVSHLTSDGNKTLDLNQVKKVISQSQKNIDVLLENVDSFNNIHEVFEKHPNLIKVFDQNILLDSKIGGKIISEINKAGENNSKVKEFSEFYLSFFLDNDGKVLEIKSKSDELMETLDPSETKKQRTLENIKNITARNNETIDNPHINIRSKLSR